MTDITTKLRASLRCDAINGDSFERSVCGRQMKEAADEIDRLRAEVADLQYAITEQVERRDSEIVRLRAFIQSLREIDAANQVEIARLTEANRYLIGISNEAMEDARKYDEARLEVSRLRHEVAQLCGYDGAEEMDAATKGAG